MSDTKLRDLERAWAQSGLDQDERAFRAELARVDEDYVAVHWIEPPVGPTLELEGEDGAAAHKLFSTHQTDFQVGVALRLERALNDGKRVPPETREQLSGACFMSWLSLEGEATGYGASALFYFEGKSLPRSAPLGLEINFYYEEDEGFVFEDSVSTSVGPRLG